MQQIARRTVDEHLVSFRWCDSKRAAAAGITSAEIRQFEKTIADATRWCFHRYGTVLGPAGNDVDDVLGMVQVWAWNYLGNWRRGSQVDDRKLMFNYIKQRAGAWAKSLSKRWSAINGAASTDEMRGRATRYLADPVEVDENSPLAASRAWLARTPTETKLAAQLGRLGHAGALALLQGIEDPDLAQLAGRLVREIERCGDDKSCPGCRARDGRERGHLAVPQADRLPLIRLVSEQVARGEGLLVGLAPKYEDRIDAFKRSIHQYRTAAQVLELLKPRGEGLQPTRHLYALGDTVAGSEEEREVLLERVQGARALRAFRWFLDPVLVVEARERWLDMGGVLREGQRGLPAGFKRWAATKQQPLLDELAIAEQEHARLTAELADAGDLSFTTAERRAGTLRSWRRELAG